MAPADDLGAPARQSEHRRGHGAPAERRRAETCRKRSTSPPPTASRALRARSQRTRVPTIGRVAPTSVLASTPADPSAFITTTVQLPPDGFQVIDCVPVPDA